MKTKPRHLLITALAILLIFCAVGCSKEEENDRLIFDVDGEVYATVEIEDGKLEMPKDPTKDGHIFGGWFFDKNVWETPLTKSSLDNPPLSEKLTVYAKWVKDLSVFDGIAFEDATYTYDGTEKSIAPTGLSDGMTVTYTGENVFTDAGAYTIKATVTASYGRSTELTATLTIEKASYDMSGVSFESDSVVYNGSAQSLAITGDLPDGVSVSYEGNENTNVGAYTVKAIFSGDENHEPIPPLEATLTITKATYDMSGVSLESDSVVYNGSAQSLAITGDLPDGVSVSYEGNENTNVGAYTVKAIFSGDENHKPIPPLEATLTITKATYDMSDVEFDDKALYYTGKEQSIYIDGTLPKGVSVSYVGGGKTATGTYTVTAIFSSGNPNYEPIASMTATLIIYSCKHSTSGEWSYDETSHWKICNASVEYGSHRVDEEEHLYGISGTCYFCGFYNPDATETYNYPWRSAEIKVQITDNSSDSELLSELRRYMSGTSGNASHQNTVDEMVYNRNSLCKTETGITVLWSYLEDIPDYRMGKNINTVYTLVATSSKNCPDIFTNFVYDLTILSLKGSLANLCYSGDGPLGANYFDFTDPGYTEDSYTDEDGNLISYGYFYEYMRSLTLSSSKMYIMASDYLVDAARAFYVVPVNMHLMNTAFSSLASESGAFKDRNNDGVFNADDFYRLILDGEWNYETLAEYCIKIASDDNTDNSAEKYDLRDRVGFALDAYGSFASAGILYSSSVSIVTRYFNSSKGEYEYEYPLSNSSLDLFSFCEKLYTLFSAEGVIAVSGNDLYNYGSDAASAIRKRFSENGVLFGSVVALGHLEYEEYREMEGGFGIAPVPIYRTADAHGASVYDGYNVQIDHLGKVCGIAACTTKFSQCTAFLNYQSMNSREIIKEYYNGVLNERNPKDVADSNAQIFALLRNSIGSGLDMMLEDAIAQYYKAYNSNSTLYKWHEMIKADEYQCTSMKIKYGEIASLRDSYLQLLKYEYEAFT